MIKKYSLVFIALLCSFFYGFGQVTLSEWLLTANGNPSNIAANVNANNFSGGTGIGTITYGVNGAFANGWSTGAIDLNDYFQVSISPNTGYALNIEEILFGERRSGTGIRNYQVRWSTDNFSSSNTISTVNVPDDANERIGNITGLSINVNDGETLIIRFYGYNAEAAGGTWRINDGTLEIVGSVNSTCTDEVDFANIQFPTTSPQTITVGNAFDVYTQTYEAGVTPNAGQDPNIEAWIGYSTSNTDPSTWTNWVPASYNVQAGNNDEYVADLGAVITVPGTYYYASRYRLNGCGFSYGGTGGNWNNDSVQLIVEPDQVDFCNVDYPKNGSAIVGGNFNVYAQAYEPGVTNAVGQGANIEAWIGYNTIGINHQPWSASGWTWVPATYDSDFGNNDVYVAEICNSQSLTANTYYFASRFRLNGSEFSYGGIQADNTGNFWDATNNNGTLNVYNNPNNATNFIGCFTDSGVDLTWSAPASGTTPDGYVVFAIEGAAAPTGTKGDANTYTANADFSIAPTEIPATLGKVVYKGTGTSASVTGLTENTNYSFAVFAYKLENGTGWSSGSGGSRILNGLAQDDVSNLTATPLTNQVTLNWSNPLPTSCFDELIIVANQGTVTFTPSGTYATIDVNYSTPNSVVYATTSTVSSKAINGLTNNLNYCFKIFTRRGGIWSDGVEVCATPILTYCDSYGDGADGFLTLINNVEFNTINNASPSVDNDYSDFTSISTSVTLGETYNLIVRVDTDGAYTTTTRAWIDWNNDGDFSDSNEDYELGNAYNVVDGATDASPLAIEVPSNAVVAATRMRVATIYGTTGSTPCQTNFDGEVEDYTINVVQPANAEINIKANNITIPNGFNAPYGLNNTLFGATDLTGPYTEKSYFISNLGATTLNLTNNPIVEIIGANPGDFIVTQQPSANAIVSGGSDLEFRIEFRPTSTGTRNAQVRIYNSDTTGSENPYIFDIQGTGTCSTTITSNIWPIEGPEDTEVTITSATDLTGAYAELNGVTMPIVSTTSGELVVTVPMTATDGNLVVYFSTGCSSTNSFDVLDTAVGGCDTASSNTLGDLFISEVTDATSGSSSFVEIYNGTPNTINLSDYSVNVYNNGSTSPSSVNTLTGSLVSGGVYVISVGTTSCTLNNLSASINQTFGSSSGINFNNNSSDVIALYKTSTTSIIDSFGELGSNSWANGLGVGDDGVNFRRKNTASPLPNNMVFNLSNWDMIDWTSCGDSDYVNIGQYDFSLGVPPNITTQPVANNTNCDPSIDLIVEGTEGVANGLDLAYRWYYLIPGDSNWTEITSDSGPFTGYNQATLNVSFSDAIDVNGYQFYCQVREDSNTCYSASKAVKINHERSFWDSGSWSSTPDLSKLAVINDNYNTGNGTGGQTSFEACNLIINAGNTLTVNDGTYIEVQNNVIVKGSNLDDPNIIELIVETQGSFVQVNNLGTFTLEPYAKAQVIKTTAPLATLYSYTYWSSPVKDALIGTALFTANPNRLYYYEANNFLDIHTDETTNGIPDDIDDNGDDWQPALFANTMEVGRGYASTHTSIGFIPGNSYDYIFPGEFNTGTILEPLSYNPANTLNHWNLVGNPYPSAIRVRGPNGLFSENSGIIKPEVYMWSQYRAPLSTNPGNEGLNFSQDDYVTINNSGSVGNGSDLDGDGDVDANDIPEEYIPSGQSFFVSSLASTDLTFNNSMRISGDNANDQFFGPNNSIQEESTTVVSDERLWLNLISDNGAANQLLIGYIDGATDAFDLGYDTKRNLTSNSPAIIYTGINDISNDKLVIQGKSVNSLNINEVIPIGFDTSIDEPTIFTFSLIKYEGSILENNTVYLKDNLLNKTHNLKESDYSFTSEVGEFTDRFEIVFTRETLSVSDFKPDNNSLQIIELQNGHVQFKVSSQFEMKSIEIIDLLGRTLYKLDAEGNSQVFSLSNFSQATYLAKVELTNGHVLTKKAIKRK